MTIQLSDRVQQVQPSPTLAVTALAASLRAQGRDVIGLGAGEPDFDTPEHIKEAAFEAIRAGKTKYTAVDGITELKQAVVDKFHRDNGIQYTKEQILVSCGGKQSFFNMAQALLNPGDEAVIAAPYWVSYPDMVKLAGAKPVIVAAGAEQRFKLTPGQLDQAITKKTRLVVLNSPSNPSGIAYSSAELEALGEVLAKYPDVVIATDDMYEHILWTDEPFTNIVNAHPDLYSRTVVLNGVSKAYSMTGWRIGYCGGPKELIAAMKKIQSQSTSNPTSISQWAAVAALNGDQECVRDMVVQFRERHDFVVEALNALPGFECLAGDGTFYAFPKVEEAIKAYGAEDDVDFCSRLLDDVGVALVPGSAFGTPGYLRLSFATSMENLTNAHERLKKALG
ncbi:MAG: pyridoxal phosphate-dependent aminotransferase [Halofilum sp. (in: g-proteobacteria)]|nr:pyridoxal phosphate-dependent aminotransferase [Halofilum sp. (in: g-proteobacteria)]